MKNKIEQFGKDHWSLFAYIETRCVDYGGVLDKNHLRIKNNVDKAGQTLISSPDWKPEYGTRLNGYFLDNNEKDKSKLLENHDDLDCFDDLEEAGLIENTGTGLRPSAKLTKYGLEIASKLRLHKANGGMFADFDYKS